MNIKLHRLSWIRNQQNPRKFDPYIANKQTYLTVQTVIDNTTTHKHTLKLASLKLLISEQCSLYTFFYALAN